MADSKAAAPPAAAAAAAPAPVAPKPEGNPAFRAMGLPRLRRRLPGRNWMIFFGVVGAWTGAVVYDRSERHKIQQKWCNAVSHLADEQLRPNAMPRKITIFLGAPPGDYLTSARDYFKEYIKPILVASGVDWEVYEGRKEGDIRYKLAETLRERRRKAGEGEKKPSTEPDTDELIESIRQRAGIQASTERGGHLVIGRHTWKEYIRGLHEGYLGPVNAPTVLEPSSDLTHSSSALSDASTDNSAATPSELSDLASTVAKQSSTVQSVLSENPDPEMDARGTTSDDASPTTEAIPETPDSSKKEEEKKPEPDLTIPYIRPDSYTSAQISPATPDTLGPAVGVGFPHLLGFLNTPIRIWRFLNRRHLAESTGASVTAFILAPDHSIRPFEAGSSTSSDTDGDDVMPDDPSSPEWQRLLAHEERDWHKIARKPNPEGQEDKERPWKEPMITDPRVTSRLRTIDTAAFIASAGLSGRLSSGPTDLAAEAVANAAGNVLAGSSGGEDASSSEPPPGPKPTVWKGGADRMDPTSWTDFLKSAIGMEIDKRSRPWEQGMQGDEEP